MRLATAALIFTAVSTLAAAALAVVEGSLGPGVALLSLAAGLVVGIVAHQMSRAPAAAPVPGVLGWVALTAFALVCLAHFLWIAFDLRGTVHTLDRHNYGDLPLHWTYIRYLANGARFWPQNPIFCEGRLRYPFGADLHAALFASLGFSIPAVLQASGLVASTLLAYTLLRWGGSFALAAFLFAGGVAGFEFLGTGKLQDYQAELAWKNLFLTLYVPQRGFLYAFPAGLLLLWSWRERLLERRPGLPCWVEGILWGTLPLFHLHSFLFLSLVFAVWCVAQRAFSRCWPTLAWALLPATWTTLEVTDRFGAASVVWWKPGWMIDRGPLVFFLLNYGLFAVLAPLALTRALRLRSREHLLALVPAAAVYGGLLVVMLAPWEWDNTKVMVWSYLLALPSIWTLTIAPLALHWRVPLLAVLFFSGFVSVAASMLSPGVPIYGVSETEGVCEALKRLPLTARVATAQAPNHPVALCGHPVVAGYGGHLWSHGIQPEYVESRLHELMSGAISWEYAARELGARYLFWGSREEEAFAGSPRPWETTRRLIAKGLWGQIYDLEAAPLRAF